MALTALGACATPGPGDVSPTGVFDPYEDKNRRIHQFNLGVDRVLFRPTARGFTQFTPDALEDMFINFSENLSEPSDMVNFLFQGQIPDAGRSFGRFIVNSTFGLFGLLDPATEVGIQPTDTDFGETLFVWGVQEGAYVELPLLGPSTQRDAVGVLMDFFTNPFTFAFTLPFDNVGFYVEALERVTERGRFSATIDSILYESADSYAQSRLIYLQARRFELGGSGAEGYIDPYTDPYDELAGVDNSFDPFEEFDAE